MRVDDDAVKWGLTHTLVVATQTVNSPDLLDAAQGARPERPAPLHLHLPALRRRQPRGGLRSLAATLAELYREEVDATGQPMSPEPLPAIKNALEHYRLDDILISTLKGEQSKWLEEGVIDKVKELTDKPVEHIEASKSPKRRKAAAAAA